MKAPRLTLALAGAMLAATLLGAASADAVPQWRLRRWLDYRQPIDPTIRPTVRFNAPAAPRYTPRYWTPRRSTPAYAPHGYRVIIR
ncbi:hypothetical protein [Botrimarina sp.]|uniref:hypothetical protein n=1 Tax=Botrimarina sp. TaxID=2795802 RepID=UPI0032EEE4E0